MMKIEEDKVLAKMKEIPRDTESVVRALCEALVAIDKLNSEIQRLEQGHGLAYGYC